MYQRIPVALRGDEADGALLEHVRRLAAPAGAQVTLLRIVGDGTRRAPVTRAAPRAKAVMAVLGSAEL